MKPIVSTIIALLCIQMSVSAQFWNGQDSIYGNEWIDYGQQYFKFKVANDGFYKLDKELLTDAGIPIGAIEAKYFQFWHLGEEMAVKSTTDGLMAESDAFTIYARKNRGEFDKHLYPEGEMDQLNPDISLFTDTATYYITWSVDRDGLRLSPEVNDTSGQLTPEPYFLDKKQASLNTSSYLNYCGDDGCFLVFSHYDNSEGYAYNPNGYLSSHTLNPTHVFTSGPDARLSIRATNNVGGSFGFGNFQISVNGSVVNVHVMEPKPFLLQSHDMIDIDEVYDGMIIDLEGLNGSSDPHAVAQIELEYPRTFEFEQAQEYHLSLPGHPSKRLLHIREFNGGDTLECWDVTRQKIIRSRQAGSNEYWLGLEGDTAEQKLAIYNPAVVSRINTLKKVTFIDYSNVDPDFIILTNKRLFDDGQGQNWIAEYATYRSSAEGGSFSTLIVTVDQLYDQFSFGIPYHPSSVRNFTQWFDKNWTDPRHVFIIGKGVIAESDRQNNNPWNLVPTYGSPGADALLVSDNFYRSLLPVGRLPVLEGSEVKTYLEKVKLHEGHYDVPETDEDRDWAKQVIHMSGGNLDFPAEIQLIRSELDIMKQEIESGMIGANVNTFQKKTSGAVVVSDNQRLTGRINDGASLLTYFGHSSVSILDFQIIDNVNTLKENDKFHVVMAMGCYAGNMFHHSRRSYGENWTLADKRGSIASIANSSAGFIPSLEEMGSKIYNNYGGKYYGQPIGLSVWDAINQFLDENRDSSNALYFSTDVELAFSLNICGDPSIRLITHQGPDYRVDPASVSVQPTIVTRDLDSIDLHFDVINAGKSIDDSVVLRIDQTIPSGEVINIYDDRIQAPSYRDSLALRVANLKAMAVGLNKINITIDAQNDIDEWPDPDAENNNDLSYNDQLYCFFVQSDDARPIYPEEFAIVGEAISPLIASTTTPHRQEKLYLFDIDTTELFNSTLKESASVMAKGGVIRWQPENPFLDSTVYYWRVSPDTTGKDEAGWRSSSFIHLSDRGPGWNQSHYFQYLKDEFRDLVIDSQTRRFEYVDQLSDIKVKNSIVDDQQFIRPRIFRNALQDWEYYHYNPRGGSTSNVVRSGVYVAVYDPRRIEPVMNPSPGAFGSQNSSGRDIPFFAFETTNYEDRVALIEFMENSIPDQHYAVFMSIREPRNSYGLDHWESDRDSSIGRSILDILRSFGAQRTGEWLMEGEIPYVFVYQQGNPSFEAKEFLGKIDEELEANFSFPGSWQEGDLISVEIGPASAWSTMLWENEEVAVGTDTFAVHLSGIRPDGSDSLLLKNIKAYQTDLSTISTNEFPRLKLTLESKDSTELTSPQLSYWRILYESLPELAVDYNRIFEFYNDTLEQGENLHLKYSIDNISNYDSDSILIHYTIVDSRNQELFMTVRSSPVDRFDFNIETFNFSTSQIQGDHTLIVTINPDREQPELHLWNNTLILPFHVLGDRRNPVLDVTFDKIHIKDKDLVAAQPMIDIRLRDENPYVALSDTSIFDISILYPGEFDPQHIFFSQNDVSFTAGDLNSNTAIAQINRQFDDGIYTLFVKARDLADNESGDITYQVRFEVKADPCISELYNYPNPFSWTTRFVYTLSGAQALDDYKLQIVAADGRIVQELTDETLGPLNVGRNVTNFVYDGTDSLGERLPNGVYFYRLIVEGQNVELFKDCPTAYDEESRDGWHRMIILKY